MATTTLVYYDLEMYGGLLHRDCWPKEAYRTFARMIAEWTTAGTAVTDFAGQISFRGFAGDYAVQVEGFRAGQVHVADGRANRLALVLEAVSWARSRSAEVFASPLRPLRIENPSATAHAGSRVEGTRRSITTDIEIQATMEATQDRAPLGSSSGLRLTNTRSGSHLVYQMPRHNWWLHFHSGGRSVLSQQVFVSAVAEADFVITIGQDSRRVIVIPKATSRPTNCPTPSTR